MQASSFLSRIRTNEVANVMPMMAMALIPIAGLAGSGLDMSRAYMTKAKLQTACDAAALATRRYMGGNAFTVDANGDNEPDAKTEGKKFFDFNFPPGTMSASAVNLTIGVDPVQTDVVKVSATTTVPTTIMKMFGKNGIDLVASCDADQDFVNNDIMLVLDVTGSMNCTAGTGDSCAYQPSEQSNSRLSRLRSAAVSLYRSLSTASSGVTIRYGFVPYSMTVNVGGSLNSAWVRSPASYHTCSAFSNGSCTSWGTTSANKPSSVTCVEERSSWDQRTAANITISGAIAQEDLDTVSTGTDNLKWPAYNTTATTGQTNSVSTSYTNLTAFCPAAASKLATISSESAFQAKLNAAVGSVGGYTNHDLGIMWGARFLSPTGMFSSTNPTTVNSMRVDRHIIFLTDGAMTAEAKNYSSFGIPSARDRMTGGTDLVAKHRTRFLNACNRARSAPINATIWVIALDVGSGSSTISPCASGSDHFYQSNGSDLANVFDTIGKEIGKLRLTK